jgi:signal transduction histidine kinase
MTISTKLTLLMATILAVVVASVLLALFQIKKLEHDGRVINLAGVVRGETQRLVKLELAGRSADELVRGIDETVDGLIGGDPERQLPKPTDPVFLEKMLVVQQAWNDLKRAMAEGDSRRNADLLTKSEKLFWLANEAAFAAAHSSHQKVVRYQATLGGLTAFTALIVVMAWGVIHRKITRPVAALSKKVGQVTGGNLQVELSSEGGDEIGVLTEAINEMVANLSRTILEVSEAQQAAEVASRAKSEFLARVGHELRTPMNSILGYTEVVLDGVDGDINSQQRSSLERVHKHARRFLELIDRVLDFSQLEMGSAEPHIMGFDIRETLGGLASADTRADDKGLAWSLRISTDVPDSLAGDPGALRQALGALVDNALEFTDQGEIEVRVDLEALEPDAAWLHFVVRDTGIGIPDEKRAAIFEAFSQAESVSTRTHGGLGLGLASCSLLVRLMGGKIWLESEEGKGSTFHFTARFRLPRTIKSEWSDGVVGLSSNGS